MTRAIVIAMIALVATPAAADPRTEAKAHVRKATEHHGAGRFKDALDELLAAYKLDPQRDLLYAIAQVHVKLESCEDAIVYYELFLDSGPEAKATSAARQAIAVCKDKLAKAQPPEPPKPEPVVQPPPEVKPVVDRPGAGAPRPRRWYLDPLGGSLAGAGVLGGVVAVIFYTGARSDIDAAARAPTYGESEQLVDGASGKRTVAMIAGGAGAALLAAGVVRYVMVKGRREERIAIVPTAGGAAISWSGRW